MVYKATQPGNSIDCEITTIRMQQDVDELAVMNGFGCG